VATIDEVYIKQSQLYTFKEKEGFGWLLTTGKKIAWVYDDLNGILFLSNLYDLEGTSYWEVEIASHFEARDAIKVIFNKETRIEL